MFAKVKTLSLHGLDAKVVTVEADISSGLFAFNIVGLAGKSVQEAKNRVCSAILNSGFELPMRKITVNLSPAELVKNSSSFDLPIAVAIILASEQAELPGRERLLWGELSLEGELLSTRGALPVVDAAERLGFEEIIIPHKNAYEAGIVAGIGIFTIDKLADTFDYVQRNRFRRYQYKYQRQNAEIHAGNNEYDFKFLKGQTTLKRVAEIAAAGAHNLLLNGVPGAGKTFISRCIPSILPSMRYEEQVEVTKIYSVSGLLNNLSLMSERPFRNPHHTSSHAALIGGGSVPKPGEVTLAHRGVLFLDEFTEFEARTLESLRQPLEDKFVQISRAGGVMTYPSDFMLIAAMNPCRCGYYGDDDPKTQCSCTQYDIEKYRHKVSGPILDRMDLQVYVKKVSPNSLIDDSLSEESSEIRKRVERARSLQISRMKDKKIEGIHSNAGLRNNQIMETVYMDDSAKKLSERLIGSLNISARGYYKLLKVARTIADLEESESVKEGHLTEAASYRLSVK